MDRSFGVILIAAAILAGVDGHGRLLEPPGRSSLWRFTNTDNALKPYAKDIKPNYSDNQLFCGGKQTQIQNGYRCGVCGDNWAATVKDNEAGGKYALGIITRNYEMGQYIDVTVQLTAAHKGFFEFRLCPWNNPKTPITHACLNRHVLQFKDGTTRYYLVGRGTGIHNLRLKLPDNVICSQCVLQWRYHTENSWGSDAGGTGVGYGPQEEFYGCSDVAISNNGGLPPAPTTRKPTTSKPLIATSTAAPIQVSTTTRIRQPQPPPTTSGRITTTEEWLEGPGDVEPPSIDCSTTPKGPFYFYTCNQFFQCVYSFLDPYIFNCPAGTVTNANGRCDHPRNVPPPCGTGRA